MGWPPLIIPVMCDEEQKNMTVEMNKNQKIRGLKPTHTVAEVVLHTTKPTHTTTATVLQTLP